MTPITPRIFLGFDFDLPVQTNPSYEDECEEKLTKVVEYLVSSGVNTVKRLPNDDDDNNFFVEGQGEAWEVFSAFNGCWSFEVGVASPVLSTDPSGLEAIRRVCESLAENINPKTKDEFIFHVHLSKGGKMLGDRLVRNLGAFIWNFESVLDKFHPPRFADPEDPYERTTLRENNHLFWDHMRVREKKGDPMSLAEALQCILDCKTGDEVIGLVNNPQIWGSQKYSLLSLSTPLSWHHGAPGMVFEQHEATLEFDRIESWIRVCTGIFELMDRTSFSSVTNTLQRHVDGRRYSPEKLLTDIGLPDLIDFYWQQFEDHKLDHFYSF